MHQTVVNWNHKLNSTISRREMTMRSVLVLERNLVEKAMVSQGLEYLESYKSFAI